MVTSTTLTYTLASAQLPTLSTFVVSGSNHGNFPLSANVYPTSQQSLMIGKVSDPTLQSTYTFKILATAQGGHQFLSSIKTLTMKCYTNYDILQPSDFQPDIFYFKGSVGSTMVYGFSDFISSHRICRVTSY